MSIDLKRQLVAQLVESSRLLRNYIDHRAKTPGTTRDRHFIRPRRQPVAKVSKSAEAFFELECVASRCPSIVRRQRDEPRQMQDGRVEREDDRLPDPGDGPDRARGERQARSPAL